MRITEVTTTEFTPEEWQTLTPVNMHRIVRATTDLLELAEMPRELAVYSDSYDKVIPGDETLAQSVTFTKNTSSPEQEYACRSRLHTDLGFIDEVSYDLWKPEREGFCTSWAIAIRGIKSTFWPNGAVQLVPATRFCHTTPINRTAAMIQKMAIGQKTHGIVREQKWVRDGREWAPPLPEEY